MQPFTHHTGLVASMDRANVDTDQIIPKQFLKRIEKSGFGQYLFFDWRFLDDGRPNPAFELNQPAAKGATILLARSNFGCGSSREHAVWALLDYGFRAVLAPSFADIFYNNCFKNGVLPVALPETEIEQLFRLVSRGERSLTIDLATQSVTNGRDLKLTFEIDASRREKLFHGLDDIALTLQHQDRIQAYEQAHPLPSLR